MHLQRHAHHRRIKAFDVDMRRSILVSPSSVTSEESERSISWAFLPGRYQAWII
jgi:hypothetical protein